MTPSVAVRLLSLLFSAFLIRQILHRLRCGTFRARGANVYRTPEAHPIWYASTIGSQVVCPVGHAFCIFRNRFTCSEVNELADDENDDD
jgi:hypothetical protein